MKVLVTGAAGFVGRHVVRRMCKVGDEVIALVDPDEDAGDLEAFGAHVRRAPLIAPEALAGLEAVDAVYHLAEAMTGANSATLQRVNVEGAEHIASACAGLSRPPVVLLLSSIAACGPAADPERARTEADPPAPFSAYGRSKLGAEEAMRRFADRVPVTVVRPAVLFGEGDRETLPFFELAARGKVRVPFSLDQRISLIHISDLAHVMQAACDGGERLSADGPADQGVYFASAKEMPTHGEVLEWVGEVLGRSVKSAITSGSMWTRLTRVGSGKLPVDPATVHAGAWIANGDKARATLRLKMRMTLTQRLDQTVAWYRAQGWL